MAEDAPEVVPVEAAAEQENAVEEPVVNGDAPAAVDGDLDNSNKRARDEGTEEQPEDEERAAKRAFAGAEENVGVCAFGLRQRACGCLTRFRCCRVLLITPPATPQ
jgi:hypothetical protein